MAFTKIVSPGIDTTGSYTVQELNTVGVMTAGTVQVGSATTVHTTGIDLGSGNITSHNINSTGIITATSFVGPVTGNITGDITATSGTFSGNVSIGGTLTYEDVTNVDSVGIGTFRNGLHVTSGSVGIGTDGPTAESGFAKVLHVYDDSPQVLLERETGSGDVKAGFNVWSGNASLETFTATPLRIRTSGNNNQLYLNTNGNIGIGTDNPGDKLSIFTAPNALVFGAKDTTRGNHIFQLLANNPAGDGELRLYKSSATGTHEKTVEIKSTGNSYFNGGDVGINTTSNNDGAHFQHYQSEVRHQSFQSTNGDLSIVTDNNTNPAVYIKGTGSADLVNVFDNTTEVFTIKDGGNVGLNATAPYYKLHMKFSNATTSLSGGGNGNWGSDGIRIENTNTTVGSMSLAHFRNYDADWHIGSKYVASNNSNLVFLAEGSEKLRIDVNGNVKIGTIADTTAAVTNTPLYIAMQTDLTTFEFGEGTASAGLVRIEDTGSDNSRYHGIEIRNKNFGDIRILNEDVATSDRGNLLIAMPDADASDGVHNKIRFNSLASSIQISGKGGAVAANTATEHTDIYIATKTGLTAVNTALGGEAAGLIRFEDKGSNDNRYHGIELRNRNSGDIRILNLDEGTTNKASLVFAIDNATTCAEAMRIKSSGVVKGSNGFIDGGSNAAGFFQLAASAGNTVVDTGISINASNGGGAMMVLASRNTSDQTATAAGMYLLDFRYNGNHVPGVTFIGGDNFCLFNKNGSNKLTVNCQSGNWSVAAFFAGYGIGNQL